MRHAGPHADALTEWSPGPAEALRARARPALAWGAARATRRLDLIGLFALGAAGVLLVLPASLRLPVATSAPDVARAFTALAWIEVPASQPARFVYPDLFGPPAAVFHVLLHVVLAGGALTLLQSDRPRPLLARFGAGAGLYAGRLLRLLLLAALAVFFLLQLDGGLLFTLAGGGAVSDPTSQPSSITSLQAARLLIVVVALLAVDLAFTVARVGAVVTDARSMLLLSWRSVRAVARHPLRFSAVYAAAAIVAVFLAAVYALAARLSPAGTVAELLLAALYVMGSIWTTLFLWASLMALLKGISEEDLARASRR